MGITIDSFRKSGQLPFRKELLNMLASGVEIDFFSDWINCLGMLFGPALFVVLNLEIMSSISAGVVGLSINDLGFGFFK